MIARFAIVAFAFASMFPAQASRPPETEPKISPVHCIAVFELMSRAEPRFMTQADVQLARLSWKIEAGTTARQSNSDLGAQINSALDSLTESTAPQHRELTSLASRCVADAPL
ncbi:MAG: hypothetical protein QNI84_02555 [Henriciella sp.]|nr:hypothetical protein [Henriciella sp.]